MSACSSGFEFCRPGPTEPHARHAGIDQAKGHHICSRAFWSFSVIGVLVMTVRSSRRLGVLAAVLAAAVGFGAPTAASAAETEVKSAAVTAAKTEVKKVGATIIYKNAASPRTPGNCGFLVILEWRDPKVAGFEPYAWTGHYFKGPASARKEMTISGTPPFQNTQDISYTTFIATGGANWFQIGWGARAGRPTPGVALDCSDAVARAKENYGTQAWVEVTGTVSKSSTAKCLAARESYDSARKKVNQQRRELRKAKTDKAKTKIRKRLNTAVRKRAQAAARAGKACSD